MQQMKMTKIYCLKRAAMLCCSCGIISADGCNLRKYLQNEQKRNEEMRLDTQICIHITKTGSVFRADFS